MGGACSTNGRNYKCSQNVSRKPEGKRQLEERGRGWENNIKMDFKDMVYERNSLKMRQGSNIRKRT
jgi:hypothetical protein